MKRSQLKWVPLVLLTAVAGCESTTAPGTGGPAPMEVAVRGDDGTGPSAYRAAGSGSSTASNASGRIDVSARVYLRTSAGEWVAVGDAVAHQTVEASGSDGYKLLSSDTVEATTYTRVRVEFERVETWISGEINFGGGLISGLVRVDAGSDGRATVERDVRINTRADATTRLDINLNADAWLDSASSSSGVVSEAEFESAVRVSVR